VTKKVELTTGEVSLLRQELSDRLCEDWTKLDTACKKSKFTPLVPLDFIERLNKRIKITENILSKLNKPS